MRTKSDGRIRAAVGAVVRREREARGMSLSQLTEATGLTFSYLLKLEKGQIGASLDVYAGIAEAVGVGSGNSAARAGALLLLASKVASAPARKRLRHARSIAPAAHGG